MNLHQAAERVGRIESLDQIAEPLGKLVKRVVPPKTVIKDLLSGTWLGHPLHPLLTDIPIGSFTSATMLDLIGGKAGRSAAARLIDVGLLASAATAAAGAADWSDTYGDERRVGVVHAVANALGVTCYAASAVARRRGKQRGGVALGLTGMAVMTVGGYLGGFLGYSRGIGVNNTFFQHPPSEWTPVLDETELADGASRGVEVEGATVLLYRRGDAILAIGSRCTHAGGPLQDGEIDQSNCTVTCPWHQSVFRLDTGEVVHGPATVPEAVYETRVANGRIEVRART